LPGSEDGASSGMNPAECQFVEASFKLVDVALLVIKFDRDPSDGLFETGFLSLDPF
jgi:hypothetical protein